MAEKQRLENAQLACLAVGVDEIDSFEEGSAASKVLSKFYEVVTESELSIHKWRCATRAFNLINSELADPPETRYNVAYQLPTDEKVMSIDTVLQDDRPINYDRYQDQIHTNDTSGQDVIVQYRFRADETLWNPYLTLLIVYRLATIVSFSVARKADIANAMKKLADEHFARAKAENSQAQSNKKVSLRRIVRGRGGSIDKFWRNRSIL